MSDLITVSADELAQWLIVRAVKADDCYNAAAGWEYGWVKYWRLPDGATFLVTYSVCGQLRCAITNSAGVVDPLHWLEDPDLDYEDTIVQTANVRGSEKVPAAAPNSKGPFGVLVTHHWYGPTETSDLAEEEFTYIANAEAWVEERLEAKYALTRNEICAPTYKIVNLREAGSEH